MRHLTFLVLLVSLILLAGCDDDSPTVDDGLAEGGWGKLVKVLDRKGETLFNRSIDEEPPVLEPGGFVLAKVVVGSVTVHSSDPKVFQVDSVEERDVGERCEPAFFSEPTCGRDYDTWFSMRGIANGDAELIVTAALGGVRRLPVHVASAESVAIVMIPWVSGGEIEIPSERFGEAVVLGEEGSRDLAAARFELRMRDSEGREILSRLQWTLETPGPAEFVEIWGPPSRTADSFWITESTRHEGTVPFVWALKPGTTRLRVKTSAGRVVETPIWIAVEQDPFRGPGGTPPTDTPKR